MKTRTVLCLFASILLAIAGAFAQDSEVVLHNFSSGAPNMPSAGLISDANGNLYGVTGVYGVGCTSDCGSVFELSPTESGWAFSTLYVFKGGSDGSAPSASLTMDAAGNLYGTTATGGGTCSLQSGGCGTVFKLTRNSSGTWQETVIHRFMDAAGGALPFFGVILDASGNLYGGTSVAGSSACVLGCGTVYKLASSGSGWSFSVIHAFTGGGDGAYGASLVFDSSGNLYGATGGGGTVNSLCGSGGCGTLFKMTPNGSGWTKSTLYRFSGSAGFGPFSLVIGTGGTLYGVALYGGNLSCSPNGCGTVFELRPNESSWTFSVIHSFTGSDGANPSGVTLDSSGNLYGATEFSGVGCCGNIFELVAAAGGVWTQTTLYSFSGGDGDYPPGPPVLDAAGNLFGVTSNGGAKSSGIAFELTP